MQTTRYLLIVIQISSTAPHEVTVHRKTIESAASIDELYAATESTARGMVREGFALSNWHLFEATELEPDTGFTLSSGKSVAGLRRWQESEKGMK